jgi:hypothetical protein
MAEEREAEDRGIEVYRNSRVARMRLFVRATWFVASAFLLLGCFLLMVADEYDPTALLILAPIIAAAALGLEYYRSFYVTRIVAWPEGLAVETETRRGRFVRHLGWDASFSGTISDTVRGSTTMHVWLRAPGVRPSLLIDTTVDTLDLPRLEAIRPRC